MRQKRAFLKGALCGALVMLLIAGVAGTGLYFWNHPGKNNQVIDEKTEIKLNTLQRLIDGAYLNADDIKEQDLRDCLLKGYVSGLQDPYSVYYNEKETEELFESTQGEYSGIGVAMTQDLESGIITFANVYKDSPAAESGFQDGDILYKVDGKDVDGQELGKIVTKIKGEEGTQVTLTVLRGEDQEEYEASITRRKVENHTVEYEMKEDDIGYLQITEFDAVTYKQFGDALEDLEEQGMQGLIVDLRGNPGGNLNTVCDILDLILPEGTIVYTKDRNGKKQTITSDAKHDLDIPMTILVDGRSASAAEIFAGAVQDYGKATLVGTTTYGKGVVQQLFELSDGTCLKLTVSEYYTPKGRNIHKKGIKPDVEVKYEMDENDPDADNQLEKAIEVMQEKLK